MANFAKAKTPPMVGRSTGLHRAPLRSTVLHRQAAELHEVAEGCGTVKQVVGTWGGTKNRNGQLENHRENHRKSRGKP